MFKTTKFQFKTSSESINVVHDLSVCTIWKMFCTNSNHACTIHKFLTQSWP